MKEPREEEKLKTGLWGWSVVCERDKARVGKTEATQAEKCGCIAWGNGEPLKVPG